MPFLDCPAPLSESSCSSYGPLAPCHCFRNEPSLWFHEDACFTITSCFRPHHDLILLHDGPHAAAQVRAYWEFLSSVAPKDKAPYPALSSLLDEPSDLDGYPALLDSREFLDSHLEYWPLSDSDYCSWSDNECPYEYDWSQ